MNLHWPLHFRKPEPADIPERGIGGRFTKSPKSLRTARREASIRCQLAVYKAITTPEQRRADAEAFRAVSMPLSEKDGQ